MSWPLPPGAVKLDPVSMKLANLIALKYDAKIVLDGIVFYRVRDGHGDAKVRAPDEVWYSEFCGVIVKDYGRGRAISHFNGWHVGRLYNLGSREEAFAAAPEQVRLAARRTVDEARVRLRDALGVLTEVTMGAKAAA